MKRYLALLLLLPAMGVFVGAQDRAPVPLFEATQCILNGKYEWVNVKDQKSIRLAYHADNKTFSGAKYLYVIVFSTPKRDRGKIFDIRLKDHRTYSIENNATFINTPEGITFPEPPLGGNWTQNQLTNSIQAILRHHKWYEVQVKTLLKPSSHLQCETNIEDLAPSGAHK